LPPISLKIYHEDANAAKPQSKVEISRKDAKAAKKIDCHFERKGNNKRYRTIAVDTGLAATE